MARPKTTPAKKSDALQPTPDELAAQAKAALEDARGAFRDASRGMYELGKALARLRAPGMSEAAGHTDGFDALVEREFELHPQTAHRLVRAADFVTEEMFTALGPARVNALLDLATATEADDTDAILTGEVVRLWKDGPHVDVANAPTEKIIEHTGEVRARAKGLGEVITTDEHAVAEAAGKRLHHEGIAATVSVRATKPGSPAEYDIVGLDQRELELLTKGSSGRP